jgi:peptidoglycan/LPS O-acetylase OafA/YrhL
MVVFGHASLLLPASPFSTGMGALFQQEAAVICFYVLSGFVLGQSLRRDDTPAPFIIRRLVRLLPVFWTSIALGIVIAQSMQHPSIDGASDWFNSNFLNIRTSTKDIAVNALALSTAINGVLWSIQVELVAIPFLLLALTISVKLTDRQNIAFVTFAAIIGTFVLSPLAGRDSILRPLAYLYCFHLGILIPRGIDMLRSIAKNGKLIAAELVLISGLYFVSWRGNTIIAALVSAHIIAYLASHRDRGDWLRWRPLIWLGDISYSLYAYGQLILVSCAFILFITADGPWWTDHPTLFISCATALCLVILLPLAWLSYHFIEMPSIELGRRTTNQVSAAADKQPTDHSSR